MSYVPSHWLRASAICLAAFACFGAGAALLTLQEVTYFEPDGSVATPSGNQVGQADISGVASSGYLNVLDPGGRWIIQNLPVMPGRSSTAYYDTGTTDTLARLGSSYLTRIDSSPRMSAPTSSDGLAPAPVLAPNSQALTNSGVPSGAGGEAAPSGIGDTFSWLTGLGASLRLSAQRLMPNVEAETNFCGPAAAANSLFWLTGTDPVSGGLGGMNLTQVMQTLSGAKQMAPADKKYMDNSNDGNWEDDEIRGKTQFLKDVGLSPRIVVESRLADLYSGRGKFGAGPPAPNAAVEFWQWIQDQIDKGQDVEIETKSHWVTLTGYLTLGSIHLLSYTDDPTQQGGNTTDGNPKTGNAQYAAPGERNVWTYFDDNGNTNIGNGNERLLAAVAESIPEPPAVLLLMLATGAALIVRRRVAVGNC